MTLGDVKAAFDAYDSGNISFTTAYIGGGVTGTGLSGFPHLDAQEFTGGADAAAAAVRTPLTAVVTPNNRRLTVTTIDGDTVNDVETVVAAATYNDADSVQQTWGAGNITHVGVTTDFGAFESFYTAQPGFLSIINFTGGVAEILRTPLTATVYPDDKEIRIVAALGDTQADVQPILEAATYDDVDGVQQTWGADKRRTYRSGHG